MKKLSVYLLMFGLLSLSGINYTFSSSTPVGQPTPVALPTPEFHTVPEIKSSQKVSTGILIGTGTTTSSGTIIICSDTYNPVCGVKYIDSCNNNDVCKEVTVYKTFINKCELIINTLKYIFYKEGVCEDNKDNSIVITKTLKLKLDNSIEKIITKINKIYKTKEKRIINLNLVIEKLNKLKDRNENYINLINYLIEKFEREISRLQEEDLDK